MQRAPPWDADLGITHQVLKDTTTFFSHSTPNLTMALPAMDYINNELKCYARNKDYQPAIHAAVSLTKKTLNRYYSLTDYSEVY